jgi:NAD(P)-dependent dehydrogenase (short-subunit alcohol dehydrogenase family)
MLVRGDITDEAQARDIVNRVRERFGFVDVLINNAGIALPTQLVTDTSLADWHRVMDTNVTGMFLVTNAALAGDGIAKARDNREHFLHVGRDRRLLRGGVFRLQSGGDRLHQGARKRGCAQRHPRQLRVSRLCADRYDARL